MTVYINTKVDKDYYIVKISTGTDNEIKISKKNKLEDVVNYFKENSPYVKVKII